MGSSFLSGFYEESLYNCLCSMSDLDLRNQLRGVMLFELLVAETLSLVEF